MALTIKLEEGQVNLRASETIYLLLPLFLRDACIKNTPLVTTCATGNGAEPHPFAVLGSKMTGHDGSLLSSLSLLFIASSGLGNSNGSNLIWRLPDISV